MSEWRPIAEAPKDGTAIWAGKLSTWAPMSFPLYPLTSKFIDGRWCSVVGDDRWVPYDPQPDVWRPLTPTAFMERAE